MFTIENPTHHTPHRILIIGDHGSGKTTFARRLSQWMVANLKTGAAVIQDGDLRLPPRTPRHLTIVTLQKKPSRRVLNRFDWIVDMNQRPARVNGVCDTCRGEGVYRVVCTNLTVPCHGYDCAKRVPCCVLAEEHTPVPSILDQMAKRKADAEEGVKQLNAVRRAVKPDIGQDEHIPSILAADVALSIDRLGTDLDVVMTALNTGLPLNDSAKEQIRSYLGFDFQRLRSQFGGLKALILQDGEQHRIINEQVRSTKLPDLAPSPF